MKKEPTRRNFIKGTAVVSAITILNFYLDPQLNLGQFDK